MEVWGEKKRASDVKVQPILEVVHYQPRSQDLFLGFCSRLSLEGKGDYPGNEVSSL